MDPKLTVAILSGKLTSRLTTSLKRGGGSAAPGLLAEKIDPQILTKLSSKLPLGSIFITGTNGKTTTSRLVGNILQRGGLSTVQNRSGSNLTRGLVSTLIKNSTLFGRAKSRLGLFEVDEAALTEAAKLINPKVLVISNLFRDQLDRYFELDTLVLRWRAVIKNLPKSSVLCLNADDPRVATLGKYTRGKVLYYGIAKSSDKLDKLPQSADILECPNCSKTLHYDEIYLGHQGKYFCANCQFKRPPLDIAASDIKLDGLTGVRFKLTYPEGQASVHLGVPGFYNVYNALAATACALALNQAPHDIATSLAEFKAVFGRIERIKVGKKEVLITLVKNPTGFNEVLRLLKGTTKDPILLALNDLIADGRDVSWIWDVDIERLAAQQATITVSGIRAWDMALRLKYAGVKTKIVIENNLEKALFHALKTTPKGQTLFILPTYTAMLGLRKILASRGHIEHFLKE